MPNRGGMHVRLLKGVLSDVVFIDVRVPKGVKALIVKIARSSCGVKRIALFME